MSKKWMMLVLAVCTCMQGVGLMAMDDSGIEKMVIATQLEDVQPIKETKSMYVTRSGKVTNVNEENGTYKILVGSEMDGTRFIVQSDTPIIDVETLGMLQREDIKEGMQVTVVLNKNTPMTMSIPPIISRQAAILVNSNSKNVEVSYFDETLTNETNTLKLNIDESTIIQNSRGEKRVFTAEDIKGQNAIVIYTISTRSIPAQTTPEYVVILNDNEEGKIEETPETEGSQELEGEAWIPVREMAAKFGYEVEWEHATKSVQLTKEDESIYLTAGKKQYSYNKETRELNEGVKLEENIVYVPEELLEVIK